MAATNGQYNLFLLAAGLGTRLRPLTNAFPKPAVPLLNVPMGYYNLRYVKSSEVKKFVVNTYHLPEKIKSTYSPMNLIKEPAIFSDESEKILGGGGALKKAEHVLDLNLPIVLCNADEVFLAKEHDLISKALAQHQASKSLATVIVMKHPEAGHKFGAVWTDHNKIVQFGKIKDLKGFPYENYVGYHAIGITILSPKVISSIPADEEKNIFYDVLTPHLSEKNCEVFVADMHWFETGNAYDYLQTNFHLLNVMGSELLGFVNHFDPSYVYKTDQSLNLISSKWLGKVSLLLGLDSRDPKKVLEAAQIQLLGNNVISKTAEPLKNKTIKDSVLFDRFIVNEEFFKS